MTLKSPIWIWALMLFVYLPKHSLMGQEARVVPAADLIPVDATSCVFAGSTARFGYIGATGPLEWTLAAANRTIRQGVATPARTNPQEAARLSIAIDIPELQPGVVLGAELRIAWQSGGSPRQQTRTVTIFSSDPFSAEREALEAAQIALFDPVGDTLETFERHSIPHSRLAFLAAVDQVQAGMLVVGEGVSLRQYPGLLPTLLRAAERGVSVLCLAPADGEFEFPQPDAANLGPLRAAFEQPELVRQYDKRFDLLPIAARLNVEPRRNTIAVRASDRGAGWSWLQLEYPLRHAQPVGSPQGKFIVCGLSVIGDWEGSPVPRYLLVKLIEELTTIPSVKEKENEVLLQR